MPCRLVRRFGALEQLYGTMSKLVWFGELLRRFLFVEFNFSESVGLFDEFEFNFNDCSLGFAINEDTAFIPLFRFTASFCPSKVWGDKFIISRFGELLVCWKAVDFNGL